MYHLDLDRGGIIQEPAQLCEWLQRAPGCGEAGTQYPYPTSMAVVDVENDYLLDVLPREMNVIENDPPTLQSLQAQAVAARSVAAWKLSLTSGYMDNSIDYQVFIPYAYEYFNNPGNRELVKSLIAQAVSSTNGQYLSFEGTIIDAEFGSDMLGNSSNEGKDYLIGVEDPISTTCGAEDNSNRWGMSQLGAYRWSRGNQCATASDGDQPWPVRWTDYRQILAHYYTGIDFLNGSGAKFAPDYRWNLLHHDAPQEMPAGQMRKITLHIQNTSAFDWDETVSLRWKLASACRTADAVVSWNHKALDPSPEKWRKGADQLVEIDVYSPRGSR